MARSGLFRGARDVLPGPCPRCSKTMFIRCHVKDESGKPLVVCMTCSRIFAKPLKWKPGKPSRVL